MLIIDVNYEYNRVKMVVSQTALESLSVCLAQALDIKTVRHYELMNCLKTSLNVVVDASQVYSDRWKNSMVPGTDDYTDNTLISPEEHCKLVETGEPVSRKFNLIEKLIYLLLMKSTDRTAILNIHCFYKEGYQEVWVIGNEEGVRTLYCAIGKMINEGLKEYTLETCYLSNVEEIIIHIQVVPDIPQHGTK